MATITTKEELKNIIFEELGAEFHNVEITPKQWENVFNKAVKRMYENDMSATTARNVTVPIVSELDKAHLIFATKKEMQSLQTSIEDKLKAISVTMNHQDEVVKDAIEAITTQVKNLETSLETAHMQVEQLKKRQQK